MPENVLTPRQTIALSALLGGLTAEQAAQAAGVNSRTLRRWQSDPAFQSAFQKAQDEAASEVTKDAARALGGLLRESVDELGKLLRSSSLTPGDKLRVINTVLARWPAINEAAVITEKIERLESLIDEQ